MKKPFLAVLLVLVAVGIGLVWHHHAREPSQVSWQGWVEGNFLFLGPDESGRLTALNAKEGDAVRLGDQLFAVQSDLQAVEMHQAEAALSEAKARLARAQSAQQRPEEIAVLEAQRTRAEAALQKSRPELARAKDLVAKGISPQSRLDDAIAANAGDRASLAAAERQIAVARLNSRMEEIAAARAVVEQAQSRVDAARVILMRRTIEAPADGVIQEIFYRPGEVVPAGRPVLSLLPPGNVKLRFFVPETELAILSLGQEIEATCDGCMKPILGAVTFVSTEAEFTPPVIFSREERRKLVFRVEATPSEGEHLRVGLPVTVRPALKDSKNAVSPK